MSFTPIRERDSGGALIKAGYEWDEQRSSTFVPLIMGMGLSILIGIFALIGVAAGGGGSAFLVFIACCAAFWFCKRGARRYGSLIRSISFNRDGSVEAIPSLAERWAVSPPHGEIASIEARAWGNGFYQVVIIDRGGHEYRAAHMIPDKDSRLIAVQLNLALSEIRAAISGSQKAAAHAGVIN